MQVRDRLEEKVLREADMQGRGWGAGVNRNVGGGESEILGIDSDSPSAQSGEGNHGSPARRTGLPVLRVAKIY